eukprot:TRINITY_DN4226_c0_g1_i1.p2 TRINITY_DN4226_c0_g1~~TRINITY_DN4226_c0_g1_i1.p2  ORF type:complete len:105 (+),score=45.45 TRINITY_DN4226_c0_g1_i1:101-415(+)
MIRRPPRSTLSSSSAASDVYKRQMQARVVEQEGGAQATADKITALECELKAKDEELKAKDEELKAKDEEHRQADKQHTQKAKDIAEALKANSCLLYTSPSPRDS